MKKSLLIICLFFSLLSQAQTGGEKVYKFLTLPTSARQLALGGAALTIEGDVNMPLWNPAAIDSTMNNKFAVNYTSFLAGITLGSATYATKINDKLGTFHGGITYLDYGSLTRADEFGNIFGEFHAYDLALSVGYSQFVEKWNLNIGSNVKIINSLIDTYSSFAIAFDFAAMYRSKKSSLVMSLVVRNLGTQLKSFNGTIEDLPLQIAFGASKQLEHVPIRWYVTVDNLQKWNLAVPNPTNSEVDFDGVVTPESISFLNNAARHTVFGAELFPEKKLTLRLGYNFRRARELVILEDNKLAGFSYGFGLKLDKLQLNYALSKMHQDSDTHTFTLTVDLNK